MSTAERAQRHRDEIRERELAWALDNLPEDCRVLELGSGNGRQAEALRAAGHVVIELELAPGRARAAPPGRLIHYDGARFPIRSAAVDVVFSSHVLEHVERLDAVLAEIDRVLADDGCCIAVMPTSTWRAATIASRYGMVAGSLTRRAFARRSRSEATGAQRAEASRPSLAELILPRPHGAHGSAVSELSRFSERAWRRSFEGLGWKVEGVQGGGLFYSGTHLFASRISSRNRRRMARSFGSSAKLYVLRPPAAQPT